MTLARLDTKLGTCEITRTRSRVYLVPLLLPRWHRSPADLLTLICSDMQTYAAMSPSGEALTERPREKTPGRGSDSDTTRGQEWLIAFLPTKHTEEVTFENIFKKYFNCNALQKHREDKPRVSYHACVGGHYLRWEGSKWQKEKKQDTNITHPRK